MPLTVFLVSLGAFALVCLIGWLDYRRICRADARLWSELPEHHLGKERL